MRNRSAVTVRDLLNRPSGWYQLLPAPSPARPLAAHTSADFAIVGAGFTGLAAARRLGRHFPSARIVVLEARRVGLGSSGRNSGIVVDVPHRHRSLSLAHHLGLTRLQRAGIEALRAVVQGSRSDCGWTRPGRIHAAAGASGRRTLDRYRDTLDAMGEQYTGLDGRQIRDIVGTDYYQGGIHTPGAVLVQPAAMAVSLSRALPANVELFEDSPVRAAHFSPGLSRLDTEGGSVTAPKVLLATNGFTQNLGLPEARVVAMTTFASLTAPDPGRAEQPGWGLVCEDVMGSTLRRTPEGRILVRNTVRYSPGTDGGEGSGDAIVATHRRSLSARFPGLADLPLEFSWGGVVGVTANEAPYFGQIRPGVYLSAGCNGVGISLATISGTLLADMAAGVDSSLLRDIRAIPKPSRVPPRFAMRPLTWASFRWMETRAGADR